MGRSYKESYREILTLLGGIVIGAAGGVLATKNYYQKKYEEEADRQIKDMEEYYDRTDSYVRGISEEGEEVNPVEDLDEEYTPMTAQEKAEIKERLRRNNRETINYAKMYQNKSLSEQLEPLKEAVDEAFAAVNEELSPLSQAVKDIADDEMKDVKTLEDRANEEHEKNKGRKPRIISVEKLGEIDPHYEEETLFYYMYNETVTTDEDEEVEEPEWLLGDCLDQYGFRSNDETVIFVQNFELSKVYEVQKIMASFYEEE